MRRLVRRHGSIRLWRLSPMLAVLFMWGCATPSGTGSLPSTPPEVSQEARQLLAVGLERFRQNDVAGAIADFTKAVELEPALVEGYYLRGLLRVKQNDVAGALADFTKAVELDPEFASAVKQRGLLRVKQNDVAGAIADFTKVVELDPTDALAFSQRGLLRARQGDRPGAIQDLRQALELGIPPQDQAILRNTLQALER